LLSKKLRKTLFIILPIALGVFLVWYFLSKLSPDDKLAIIKSFKAANYWWVLLSLVLGALSHLSRAYRWHFMLEPMGYKPRFANTVMTVFIAYLVNLVVPRAGDIARGSAISKYEGIPIEKAIGTIVAERIADVIMLLIIISLAFFLQADLIKSHLFKEEDSNSYLSIFLLVVIGVLGIIGVKLIQKAKSGFLLKIKTFINGLVEGAISIFKMKKKWAFIFHTVFIWVMYVLMFYVVTLAIPETSSLPFEAIIVGFVVGGISMAVTNGGLGTYPIAVASVLILYAVPDNPARAFAWIMWTAQTLMVLLFGGLAFLILPLYNRKEN